MVFVLRVLGDRHQPISCPVRHDPLLLDAGALKCKSWGSDWNKCDKIVDRESSVSASLWEASLRVVALRLEAELAAMKVAAGLTGGRGGGEKKVYLVLVGEFGFSE